MEETRDGREKPSLIIPFKSALLQKSKTLFSFLGTQHIHAPAPGSSDQTDKVGCGFLPRQVFKLKTQFNQTFQLSEE